MSSEGTISPAPAGYTINLINPEYIGYQLVITSIASAGFSALFLALRLCTRKFVVRSLGWDDWWIICAWLSAVALTVTDCIQTKYGAGIHLWDVTNVNFESFLKVQLILGSTYIAALAFAKVSICCFYLRLSPDRTFRILVFIVIAFTASYSFAGFLVVVFSCNPVAASWDLALAALPTTTCVNRPADYLAQAGLNIATDICIFLLPLRTIWNLQLPFRQKLSVSSIFAVGLFVCIISTIRLKSVVTVLNSADLSWDTSELLIWSTIEAHITIVCACIATLKPLVKLFFPRLLGKSYVVKGAYPSIPGKSTKLTNNGSSADKHSFALQSYRERAEAGHHNAIITSNAMRDPRRRDGETDSQESIINGMGHDMEFKEGVFVTRTVHVS